MGYTLQDLSGLLVATALCGPLLLLPGLAIGQFTNVFQFRAQCVNRQWLLALLLAAAVLPGLDAVLVRSMGLGAVLVLNLALGTCGTRWVLSHGFPRLSQGWLIAGTLWFAVLALITIDFDWNGALYVSLLKIDMVKHAATIRALVESGFGPPTDVFFLRDQPAGYYYYFYILSALVEQASCGLADSRAAMSGQVFWTAIAVLALLTEIYRAAGFSRAPWAVAPLMLALMCTGGLDLVVVAFSAVSDGKWLAQINWWNEEVTGLAVSIVWVAHHMVGLIACWVGLLALASLDDKGREARAEKLAPVLVAGLAFASAQGLSIWVTIGAVATMAVWCALLALERRWSHVAWIAAAGAVSALVAAPHLIDLMGIRSHDGAPLAFSVRRFPMLDALVDAGPLRQLIGLAALPLNYAIEFGVLAVGAFAFWRRRTRATVHANRVAQLLTLSAVAALVIGSFVKSAIANNDLGWRVLLFTQVAATLWTAAVLEPYWIRFARGGIGWRMPAMVPPRIVMATFAIGFAGMVYDLAALRLHQPLAVSGIADVQADPKVAHDIRAAYDWLNANIAHTAVTQHNPSVTRSFAYGLYGRMRVAVSDRHNAILFGARHDAALARLADLVPAFDEGLSVADAAARLDRNHVGLAVVTSADPAWAANHGWVWQAKPVYANAHVKVFAVSALKDEAQLRLATGELR